VNVVLCRIKIVLQCKAPQALLIRYISEYGYVTAVSRVGILSQYS
jgi:hypothetical protein